MCRELFKRCVFENFSHRSDTPSSTVRIAAGRKLQYFLKLSEAKEYPFIPNKCYITEVSQQW